MPILPNSFRDKWNHNPKLTFDETIREGSEIFSWILGRNGFADGRTFSEYLRTKRRILDAGCGNGRVTALLRRYSPREAKIVAVDLVSAGIARENLASYHLSEGVSFIERDLLSDLSDLGSFDFIYCQEVLHHLSNPEVAFRNLTSLLSKGGEIAIYVYRKKAPVREWVDDYVRDKISNLSYDEALQICEQITELGRVLHECQLKIKVPRIDVFEIKDGEYDLQRFFYHFFMKCFWNPQLSFRENAVINYDWYHPKVATRHTLNEIRGWFLRANLTIVHENEDLYGLTVRGELM